MGLNKALRLKKPQDFARLKRYGTAYRHRYLLISVLPNDLGHNRYGIVTGKRIGNAVERNRIRRLIREAIRLRHPALHAGHDIVIVAHPALKGKPFHTVQLALDDVFNQAKLSM